MVCCGEEAGARNLVFFRVKWLQLAMKGSLCLRRVRASLGVVRSVMASSMCFACSCALQFHGVLKAVVAKRIVMAAWVLHEVCCGEEAGARNLVFFCVKWLQLAMKSTLCVQRVRAGFGQVLE